MRHWLGGGQVGADKNQVCYHATTIYTQEPSMWKCGNLFYRASTIKVPTNFKVKERDLTKFLGSCINFIWCHPGVPVSHNSFNIFQVALENFQILPRYLGTEARNRSASLTYPSTSTNISLIFFFACKSMRLILFRTEDCQT